MCYSCKLFNERKTIYYKFSTFGLVNGDQPTTMLRKIALAHCLYVCLRVCAHACVGLHLRHWCDVRSHSKKVKSSHMFTPVHFTFHTIFRQCLYDPPITILFYDPPRLPHLIEASC